LQLKIRGHRVEPADIERRLRRVDGIRHAAVIGRTSDAADTDLVAYVVAGDGASVDATQLRRRLSEQLPAYMVPRRFVLRSELPETPSGKLDRRALAALSVDGEMQCTAPREYAAPKTDIERHVATLWQRVLRVERIGLDDNFFDLGGHSLLLIQVHTALQDETARTIPMLELLRRPTVREVCAYWSDNDRERALSRSASDRGQLRRHSVRRRRNRPPGPPADGSCPRSDDD
jgi:acyl carrier protein